MLIDTHADDKVERMFKNVVYANDSICGDLARLEFSHLVAAGDRGPKIGEYTLIITDRGSMSIHLNMPRKYLAEKLKRN